MAITNKVVKELNNELLKALGTAADLSAALANIAYQENAVDATNFYNELVDIIREQQASSKSVTGFVVTVAA
jgi:hypothetical protein